MKITAYQMDNSIPGWELKPAPKERLWMDETSNRFAYRCLPLLIANQAGWVVTCPVNFSVWWQGFGKPSSSMHFKFENDAQIHSKRIKSHFGSGILTFVIPYLFRTPDNVQLSVRGLPNHPKMNCSPLEGIVETDWSPYTFTMNWKVHLPYFPVRFKKMEPICFIQPISLATLESTEAVEQELDRDPNLSAEHSEWSQKRHVFNTTEANLGGWQKHYFQGHSISGQKVARQHRTQLKIRAFSSSPSVD
jgi:hypothetical protein